MAEIVFQRDWRIHSTNATYNGDPAVRQPAGFELAAKIGSAGYDTPGDEDNDGIPNESDVSDGDSTN